MTLRFTYTPNDKSEFVQRDQVFPLIVVYCLSFLTPVLSARIVLDGFYVLFSCSEKFSTYIWRLPFVVNVTLNLSIVNFSGRQVHVFLCTGAYGWDAGLCQPCDCDIQSRSCLLKRRRPWILQELKVYWALHFLNTKERWFIITEVRWYQKQGSTYIQVFLWQIIFLYASKKIVCRN